MYVSFPSPFSSAFVRTLHAQHVFIVSANSFVRRALVLYNAVAAAAALAAPNAGQHPILRIGGQELASLCHNNLQQTVLAMPGRDVAFVRGRITPQQVATQRPSYVNALLIQSRGVVQARPCSECSRRGLSPFPECAMVAGHFGGSCGNCKWRDHAARCHPSPAPADEDDGNDSDEVVIVRSSGPRRPAIDAPVRRGLLEAGDGSRGDPLVID